MRQSTYIHNVVSTKAEIMRHKVSKKADYQGNTQKDWVREQEMQI